MGPAFFKGTASWGLAAGTAVIVFFSLRVWRLFPIYPDEITFRIVVSRVFFDSFDRIAYEPFCGSSSSVTIPFIYYPAAVIFAGYSFFENLTYNRYIAIAILAVSFALLRLALYRLTPARAVSGQTNARGETTTVDVIFCGTILLCCIGVLPATYVMLRGESAIYLLAPVLILSFSRFGSSRTWIAPALAAFIMLLFTMGVYQHPKALFFLPAVGVSVVGLLWRWSRTVLAVALLVLIWAGVDGYRIQYTQSWTCPENQAIESFLRSNSIDPTNLFSHPLTFLAEVAKNNTALRLERIYTKSSFANSYDIDYLPGLPKAFVLDIANVLITCCWLLIATLSVFIVAWYGKRIYVGTRLALTRGEANTRDLIDYLGMFCMYLGVTAHLLLNRSVAWYDAGTWFFLYLMLAAPSLLRILEPWLAGSSRSIRSAAALSILLIFGSATMSVFVSNRTFYRSFQEGYAGPGISIATFGFPAIKSNIQTAMGRCGLSPNSPRLIIDDLTYPFVQRSYKPISLTYALFFITAKEMILRAKAIGSSGIVIRCSSAGSLPNVEFIHDGAVCCLNFDR